MKALNLILSLALVTGLAAFGADTPVAAEAPSVDTSAAKEPVSLDSELQKLATESNQAPAGVSSEKLYAVQYRYAPLKYRHEVSLGGARNFNSDSFTTSHNLDLAYRFYLSDRWFVGLSGSYVFNDFNSSGERQLAETGLLPDALFTKHRADLAVGYNLFYGKFRVSMDQVFYFDQYLSIGPGHVWYTNGANQWGVVGDIGFAALFGRHFSLRVGLKDFFVKEVRKKSNGMVHNLLGHLEFGYLF
jgi:outer membrane beta-barrel protein